MVEQRRETPAREISAEKWDLHFSINSNLEPVYLVYTAEKNRGLTLRLHFMLIVAWAVGTLKTVFQALHAYKHSESAMIPQCAFLLSVQLLNLGFRISSFHILKSVARKDQVLQEKTKAWLHILLDIAVMSSVILSDPYLPHSPTPVSTMIVTAFLAVLDMFRLDTLLGLYSIKWVCFALLEVGQYMRVPSITLLRVGRDVLQAFTFGTVLPLTVAAISEAYQRESFLRDCRKSMRELKPFWSSLLGMIHRLPGLSGNPLPQDPHRD